MEVLQSNPEESLRRIVFKLRFYREAAGVSQKQASEKLSVGHRSYQRIEGGETNVDVAFLLRFSQLFNVNFMELVTPYAPIPKELILYKTPEELRTFESHAFVKETQFIEWVNRYQVEAPGLVDSKEFSSSPRPMCLWTPSKKIMNDSMLSLLEIKKEFRKMNFYFLRPDVRLNFLDNLYYYRPKYSLKKVHGTLKNGGPCEVELYSFHHYVGDDITSFSLLNFLTIV